jgi:hypothetical protein
MCEPREPQVVRPAGLLAPCLVRPPARRLPCLTTVCARPPHAAEPDQRTARGPGQRSAERVGQGRFGAWSPLQPQPDRTLWEPRRPSAPVVPRQGIRHRPCGPCRACPPLPRPGWQGRGQSRDARRSAGGRRPGALRPGCALLPIDLRLGGRPLRPTTRLRGEGHQRRGPPTPPALPATRGYGHTRCQPPWPGRAIALPGCCAATWPPPMAAASATSARRAPDIAPILEPTRGQTRRQAGKAVAR